MLHESITQSELHNRHRASAFLRDIIAVYRLHSLTLAHEDPQGAFIISGPSDENIAWLREAQIAPNLPDPEAWGHP